MSPARKRQRRERLVRISLRVSPTMRARLRRFAGEWSVTEAVLLQMALGEYIDRIIARRQEAYVEIPEPIRNMRGGQVRAPRKPPHWGSDGG